MNRNVQHWHEAQGCLSGGVRQPCSIAGSDNRKDVVYPQNNAYNSESVPVPDNDCTSSIVVSPARDK